jgi:hypothetical protein
VVVRRPSKGRWPIHLSMVQVKPNTQWALQANNINQIRNQTIPPNNNNK